jgi:hypothetical protein
MALSRNTRETAFSFISVTPRAHEDDAERAVRVGRGDVAAVDTAHGRHPGDRFAITAVQGEGDTHPLTIVEADRRTWK